jgi:FdhD protein
VSLDLDGAPATSLSAADLQPEPTLPRPFVRMRGDRPVSVEEPVITEIRFSINVNGRELVTLMCSPWKLRALVLGFLYVEGFLDSPDEVELLRVCLEDRVAEVVLRNDSFVHPERKILTSGCTGGATFGAYLEDLDRYRVGTGETLSPAAAYAMMNRLYQEARLYHQARGVHTSILTGGGRVLAVAEDIGRHNTLDKIVGQALLEGTSTQGRQIFTSGRISSEMLLKSAIMGIGIVGSRTSPTGLALTLAERLNITVLGYIRPDAMNVYSNPWRIHGAV